MDSDLLQDGAHTALLGIGIHRGAARFGPCVEVCADALLPEPPPCFPRWMRPRGSRTLDLGLSIRKDHRARCASPS